MKLRNLIFALLILSGFALKAQTPEPKVLFIGIDGVRSDALIKANSPNIDRLIREGTFTFTSWHLRTTVSGPSWSAMLTGVWEEKHGVTNNNYTNPNWNSYPYFVTRAKEIRPEIKAVQITSWAPMSTQVFNDGWDQKIVLPEDNDCVAAGVAILQNDTALDVLFVHIDDVDAVGHANGFNPNFNTYINAIEYADVQVGQLMAALESRANIQNESWIVMLTTDHGGIGNGHGGVTKEEREIWWVGWSNQPNVLPAVELVVNLNNLNPLDYVFPNANDFKSAPLLVDIAVTALDHLLPNVDPTKVVAWNLDGKSWLNRTVHVDEVVKVDVTRGEVFPNPSTHGHFTLSMKNVKSQVEWIVYDIQGKKVLDGQRTFDAPSFEQGINLKGRPSGIYLLEVRHQGQSMAHRIMIE